MLVSSFVFHTKTLFEHVVNNEWGGMRSWLVCYALSRRIRHVLVSDMHWCPTPTHIITLNYVIFQIIIIRCANVRVVSGVCVHAS